MMGISIKWRPPPAGSTWTRVVLSSRNRWKRTHDRGHIFVAERSAAPYPDGVQVVALCRASAADAGDLSDGRDAGRRHHRAPRRGDGAERPCLTDVEALPRRHGARPAAAEGRGIPAHFSLGSTLPL